jgi:transcriptional regulator with XRE-family HTH domain
MNGEELKSLMTRHRITNVQLAKILDVSTNAITRWRTEEVSIDRRTEYAIRYVLERIDELLEK